MSDADRIAALEADLATARAEIERLQKLMSGDPESISTYFDRQGFEVEIKHWAVRLIAHSLWNTFEEVGGPNFLSMEVFGASDKGPIEVTLRPRWGSKTPVQLLVEANAELDKLRQELANMKGGCSDE